MMSDQQESGLGFWAAIGAAIPSMMPALLTAGSTVYSAEQTKKENERARKAQAATEQLQAKIEMERLSLARRAGASPAAPSPFGGIDPKLLIGGAVAAGLLLYIVMRRK